MAKFYSLPDSLSAILKKYPIISDVDFGRARTFRGREIKALKAGYKRAYISFDNNGEIITTTVYYKKDFLK